MSQNYIWNDRLLSKRLTTFQQHIRTTYTNNLEGAPKPWMRPMLENPCKAISGDKASILQWLRRMQTFLLLSWLIAIILLLCVHVLGDQASRPLRVMASAPEIAAFNKESHMRH